MFLPPLIHPFQLVRPVGLAGLILLAACSAPGGPPIEAVRGDVAATATVAPYSLGPGDRLVLVLPVPGGEGRREEVLVESDGWVRFSFFEPRVRIAGLSIAEAQERIDELADEAGYGVRFSLQLLTSAARHVAVLGEVARPGRYELRPDEEVTLQELLALAGGFDRTSARLDSLVLVRWCPERGQQVAFTIDARPREWTGPLPLLLQPHDLVFVPQTTVDQVNIWLRKNVTNMLPFPNWFLF